MHFFKAIRALGRAFGFLPKSRWFTSGRRNQFFLCQSLPQTLQPSEFVIFIAKDIENSSPTPSSTPVRWQIITVEWKCNSTQESVSFWLGLGNIAYYGARRSRIRSHPDQ